MTRNCDWFERRTAMKCIWFDACQFRICFKCNRWKWIATWKAFWTKNLNMTRNCDRSQRRTLMKCFWFDACQFRFCFKWNWWKWIAIGKTW
jgi:hypothetical protein